MVSDQKWNECSKCKMIYQSWYFVWCVTLQRAPNSRHPRHQALKIPNSIHITRVCLMKTKTLCRRRTKLNLLDLFLSKMWMQTHSQTYTFIHMATVLCQSASCHRRQFHMVTYCFHYVFEIFAAHSNPFAVWNDFDDDSKQSISPCKMIAERWKCLRNTTLLSSKFN